MFKGSNTRDNCYILDNFYFYYQVKTPISF